MSIAGPKGTSIQYISLQNFSGRVFNYSLNPRRTVGTLTPVSVEDENTAELTLLRYTGRRLLPGAYPGVSTLMVHVRFQGSTSHEMYSGYIDPKIPSIFAPYNEYAPSYLDATVSTNLFTAGVNTSGNLNAGGTLDVSGAARLSSTLDVSGATRLNSTLDVSGATTISSSLVVATTLDTGSDASIGGKVYQESYLLVPIGSIFPFAGASVPVGYLLCNGATYSVSTYPLLFNAIGGAYGGNGTTTFAVPNFQQRMPIGAGGGYTLSNTGGVSSMSLGIDQLPSHTHSYTYNTTGSVSDSGAYPVGGAPSVVNSISNDAQGGTTGSAGNGQVFNTMNPYIVVNYIIKY